MASAGDTGFTSFWAAFSLATVACACELVCRAGFCCALELEISFCGDYAIFFPYMFLN